MTFGFEPASKLSSFRSKRVFSALAGAASSSSASAATAGAPPPPAPNEAKTGVSGMFRRVCFAKEQSR
jgi:hypothetical protein